MSKLLDVLFGNKGLTKAERMPLRPGYDQALRREYVDENDPGPPPRPNAAKRLKAMQDASKKKRGTT